ncbi:acyltransferase family protein [Nocardioides sp. T5]|uniref:acyltransferase family protein n=1 Tax=Nocardioides sp. T5 TaxID=3400182 RepID=UPI003A8747FB
MTDLRTRWHEELRCRRKYDRCPHASRHLLGRRPRASSGRWDIQGLRAFAVIAVILDHLVHWPAGGFVGVDVFFVISGFLITGLLLREHEKTGRISFLAFYRRRAKRILPAALVVLAVTVAASAVIFGQGRARSTATDAVWAALFAGNWRFAAQSTDYFQADGPVSPIQHYWSLSVEEQFYFVWPWVMLGILALLARRHVPVRQARRFVGAVLLVVTLASFVWALYESAVNPNQAYFSTFSRVWELGVGALLAVAAPVAHRIPDAVRPALAWAGLAAMTASLWVVTPASTFPAPWAALPVLATALVIAAGTFAERDSQAPIFPLTNRVSGYVGDISYSLYLWHFPISILGVAVIGESPQALAALGVLILVVSVYSYHLLEDPVRKSSWLEPRGTARENPWEGLGALWLSALALCVVAMCISLLRPIAPVDALDASEQRAIEQDVAVQRFSPALAGLQIDIREALQAEAWPRRAEPSMDEAINQPEAPADVMPCGQRGTLDVAACTWGPDSPSRKAVIVGDSVSMTYVSVLRDALPSDWSLTSAGTFGCAYTSTLISNPDAAITAACEDRKAQATAAIKQLEADVVFVTNTYEPRVPIGSEEPLTPEEWKASSTKLLKELEDSVGAIVMLSPPPSDLNLADCYSRLGSPSRCISEVTGQWLQQAAAEKDIASNVGGQFVDSRHWFCADDLCPAFVGSTPMKSDQVHITPQYQKLIVPAVTERLKRVLRSAGAAKSQAE